MTKHAQLQWQSIVVFLTLFTLGSLSIAAMWAAFKFAGASYMIIWPDGVLATFIYLAPQLYWAVSQSLSSAWRLPLLAAQCATAGALALAYATTWAVSVYLMNADGLAMGYITVFYAFYVLFLAWWFWVIWALRSPLKIGWAFKAREDGA